MCGIAGFVAYRPLKAEAPATTPDNGSTPGAASLLVIGDWRLLTSRPPVTSR